MDQLDHCCGRGLEAAAASTLDPRREDLDALPRSGCIRVVLGQVAVDATVAGEASEIDQFSPLLDALGHALGW